MKIGNSFGRCIRDIVLEKVDINDVLLIICRTHMENIDHVYDVIKAYMDRPTYLYGLDEEQCVDVARRLYKMGKLHQPRLQGVTFFHAVSESIVWMDVVPTELVSNPAVQQAWETYRMMLTMVAEDAARINGNASPSFDDEF